MLLPIGVYGHWKRVCTESWLWEENPLLHWEIEPVSAAWQSGSLTNWATSHPLFWGKNPSCSTVLVTERKSSNCLYMNYCVHINYQPCSVEWEKEIHVLKRYEVIISLPSEIHVCYCLFSGWSLKRETRRRKRRSWRSWSTSRAKRTRQARHSAQTLWGVKITWQCKSQETLTSQ